MSSRLMLVADDPLSASALRRAFRATGAFEVMDGYVEGRAPCGATLAGLRARRRGRRPHAVARGHRSPASARPAPPLPAAKIVLLPARMEPAWLAEAAGAGVDAAIAKTFRLEGLGALVREVAAGNVFHAFGTTAPRLRSVPPLPGLPTLTDRELEVLRLVAAGAPNSRIAAQLWITEQTVKFHLSKVYRKLGVSNRTEASHHAYVHGLLDDSTPRTGVAA